MPLLAFFFRFTWVYPEAAFWIKISEKSLVVGGLGPDQFFYDGRRNE